MPLPGITGRLRGGAVPSVSLAYLDNAGGTVSSSSYTFSGLSFGAAVGDREIVALLYYWYFFNRSITAVTIGGVSATHRASIQNTADGALGVEIWSALVPTGTSGSVEITMSGGVSYAGVGLYRLTGLISRTPHATATAKSSTGIVGTTIPVLAGGVAVGVWGGFYSGPTWTGLTEDFKAQVSPIDWMSGASATFVADDPSLSVTATAVNNFNERALAVVSWR